MLMFIIDCFCGGAGLLLLSYCCARAMRAAQWGWIAVRPVEITANIILASASVFLLSNFAIRFAILWHSWD